ncbi:MAG TPA: AMP-binding protein [Pseudonocardiaceae bacterium]|nr:AMP-binding protein [Pseudonocardiaceae bacterium]
MSNSAFPHRRATAIAALADLGMRIGDRVLIMLPDGPGFAELITCVEEEGGVPLPLSPQLSAQEVARVAAAARARLVLIPVDRIPALADLSAEPVLMNDPQGPWAAGFRLPADG